MTMVIPVKKLPPFNGQYQVAIVSFSLICPKQQVTIFIIIHFTCEGLLKKNPI